MERFTVRCEHATVIYSAFTAPRGTQSYMHGGFDEPLTNATISTGIPDEGLQFYDHHRQIRGRS